MLVHGGTNGSMQNDADLIGVSLSKPHTGVTALRMSVSMLACLLGPTTYRRFQMHEYIQIFHEGQYRHR